MASSSFLLLLLPLCFLHFTITGADTNLIVSTCNQTNYFYLCVTTIEADASCYSANVSGLAIISVEQAKEHLTSTQSILSDQLQNATDSLFRACLKNCLDLYDIANRHLQDTLVALNAKSYDFAQTSLGYVFRNARTCRDVFDEFPYLKYPPGLQRRETDFTMMSNVSAKIIDLIGG